MSDSSDTPPPPLGRHRPRPSLRHVLSDGDGPLETINLFRVVIHQKHDRFERDWNHRYECVAVNMDEEVHGDDYDLRQTA